MASNNQFKKNILLTLGVFSLSASELSNGAEIVDVKSKPSTTLSAAASAANAAVSAANSAAAAASAAAEAAAAAVNAMNAILPPSERIQANIKSPLPAQNSPLLDKQNTNTLSQPSTAFELKDTSADAVSQAIRDELASEKEISAGVSPKFSLPTEHTLSSLIGSLEVVVDADTRKEFTAGVASFRNIKASPVEGIAGIDLAQAVKASLGFSRGVLIASSRLDQAKAQTGQSRAFMLPSLLVNLKAGQEISTPGAQIDTNTGKEVTRSSHSRQDSNVTLRQPLLDLAGLYDWKRRKVIEESRQEGVRTSQGETYIATVTAYLALASSRIQANMAIDYENQLKELFQYIDKRAQAGAASNADKERVRARLLSAKSARVEQEAAQAAAGIELVRLINLAPASLRLPELEDVGVSIVPKTLDEEIKTGRMTLGMMLEESGRNLSGGQRQKVALARTFAQSCRILLLDEPTLGLDPDGERLLAERLPQLLDKNTVLIMTTHSAVMLSAVKRVIALDGGKIVADGDREKLLRVN